MRGIHQYPSVMVGPVILNNHPMDMLKEKNTITITIKNISGPTKNHSWALLPNYSINKKESKLIHNHHLKLP